MAFLTDRVLATGVTPTDLIHIVITGDTSQNPAGSSYKATIEQVQNVVLTYTTSAITTSSATLVTGITYYGVNYNGDVDLTIYNPTGIDGVNLFIKDEGGYAGTNRIRINGGGPLIDGNSYVDMNINNMSLHLIARNGGWWII